MSASDSDRLLAAGVPLTLADGKPRTLRFTMRSLKAFEDHFGSVGAATDALNTVSASPRDTKLVSTLVPVLAIGLEDVTEDDLYDGNLLALNDMMDVYFPAISAALDQAFPAPGKDEAAAPAAAAGSPGPASTTRPQADLVGATTSSGA